MTSRTRTPDCVESPTQKSKFKFIKPLFYIIAVAIHFFLIVTITVESEAKQTREDNTIFKLVDITEQQPEQNEKSEKKERPKDKTLEVEKQDNIVEDVIVTNKTVVEKETIDYFPQHKISVAPVIPGTEVLNNIVYPKMANLQKIEGVVYLELYIDRQGEIRKITVLKDPGYGLAEAAVQALAGIQCKPAIANHKTVAVKYRYPIRFKLK